MKLQLAKNLAMPADAVTRTFAILGIRGSGKTNTGVVLTEELLKAPQQVIVLDPVDVWWGLRSSADGKASGFPVTILGGEHADLPLEAAAGALIADFAVEHAASLVLSLRHLSIKDQRHFATDFAERLYARKGQQEFRQPLHLMVDECDEFIPQKLPPGGERMFGAFDRLVRRGRASGIGITMISQRAQVVNKDVLSQIETLVCHRVLHKLDRKALEAWIEAHDIHGRRDEFMASLAALGRGDAWVWSPEWLDLFERVHFRARETFDSSATPKAGAQPAAPKRMAEVDLAQLRGRMAAVLERAKAEDPRQLKQRIAQLEGELRKKTPAADPEALDRARRDGERAAEKRLQPKIDQLEKAITAALRSLQSVNGFVPAKQAEPAPNRTNADTVLHRARATVAALQQRPMESDTKMSGGERKILSVLAQYPQGRTDTQVAILTGYAVGSGGFNNLLSSLRSKGWAEGPRSALKITPAGVEALGPCEPLPIGHELLEYWYAKLGKAERSILGALSESYPEALSDEEIADRTGYTAGSGGFNNAISRLRTLELIGGSRKELKASDALF